VHDQVVFPLDPSRRWSCQNSRKRRAKRNPISERKPNTNQNKTWINLFCLFAISK